MLQKNRQILNFTFKNGKITIQAAKERTNVYGTNAMGVRVVQNSLERFQLKL